MPEFYPQPDLLVTTSQTIASSVNYNNVTVTNGATLTVDNSATLGIADSLTVDYGATLTFTTGFLVAASGSLISNLGTLTLDSYSTASVYNVVLDGTTITINGTLTIAGTATYPNTATSIVGAGYITTNGTFQFVVNCTIIWALTFNGSGTVSIPASVSLALNISLTFGGTLTFSGAGTITFLGSATLIIATGATVTFGYTNGVSSSAIVCALVINGTLLFNYNYALTNTVYATTAVTGSGTMEIGSGYTLFVEATQTWPFTGTLTTYGGSATLTLTSSYILTFGAYFTLDAASGRLTVNDSGTGNYVFSATGVGYYSINPTAGATSVLFTALKGGATSGNFQITGTFYCTRWVTSDSTFTNPASPTSGSITGNGIWICGTNSTGTAATNAVTFGAITAGGLSANHAVGTGKLPYTKFSAVALSAAGIASVGIYDNNAGNNRIFTWIYAGTTGTYTVDSSIYFYSSALDTTSDTIYAANGASVINIAAATSGTLYV